MNQLEKVSGERIGAAILDLIFLFFISIIPSGILMFSLGIDDPISLILSQSLELDPSPEFIIFTISSGILGLVMGILYFGFVPAKMNGQTLGKKIMNVKVIKEDGSNPKMIIHLIRAVQNWTKYYVVPTSFLMYVSVTLYGLFAIFIYAIYVLIFISLIMMITREDGRGLHDLIAGTKVIRVMPKGILNDSNILNANYKPAVTSEWIASDDENESKDDKPKEWDF